MTESDIRTLIGFVLGLILAGAIMGLANMGGPTDAELDAAEVQMWQERGVEIGRW